MGELGYLEGHLNIGERYGDCQALVIGCKYGCSHSDQRCNLTLHETSECPKRPYSCDYCGDYQSTCEDVTENHWTICKDYPVECPNTCTTRYLSRGKLEEHLDKVCELQEIPCPFHWAGCSVKIQRIKLEEHIKLAMADHLQKICTASCDLIGEVGNLTNSMEELRKEKRAMKLLLSKMERDDVINKQHISDLSSNLHTMTEQLKELEKNNENLKQQIDQVNYENKAEKEQLDKRLLTLESSIGLPPFYFTMTDFQKILAEKTSYFSPPFYTHIGGYRMCIKVTPCGIFFGEDTHVSLTVHIMKGAFDDNLEWPFCGKITIALLDRLNDKDHCVDTITFNKKTSVKASGRVKSGDVMNGNGVVSYNFADLAWLKPNSRRKSCYLPDDSLHFKVLEVTIN
jgi:TNF receptor-associated factor 4